MRGGLKCKSPRALDIINIGYGAYLAWCKETGTEPHNKPKWFTEIGTSAERNPWGESVTTVSTKGRYYYYLQDQILSAQQLSYLHGYPAQREDDTNISQCQMRKLLGNSVYLPHMTRAVVAAFCIRCAPWHGDAYRQVPTAPATGSSDASSSAGDSSILRAKRLRRAAPA